MFKPLQVTGAPLPRAQQSPAVPLQAGSVAATQATTGGIDLGELMNLMITMMIVVMMMKMMGGMMEGVGG